MIQYLILPAMMLRLVSVGAMGQGTFQNLSFEDAVFVPIAPSGGGPYHWQPALPGWTGESTAFGVIDQVYGRNELLPLDRGLVVVGTGPGSLVPRFGSYGLSMHATAGEVVSLWQTGVIPATARSIQVASGGTGPGAVTINGNSLEIILVESAIFYSVYVADVSQFAGQTAELRFSTAGPVVGLPSQLSLAHIQFSPLSVPEPPALALLALGISALWLARRHSGNGVPRGETLLLRRRTTLSLP